MSKCIIPHKEAEGYLNEGDVLLFRKPRSLLSNFIRASSDSPYSHAGLVSFSYNKQGERSSVECVEFKEWYGGRSVSLANYVQQYDGEIDVFSPHPYSIVTYWNCEARRRVTERKLFKGRFITSELRNLTGLPYGWTRIFKLAARSLFTFRFWFRSDEDYDDTVAKELVYPVCSTAVAWCYAKHYVDLTPQRADHLITPGDLSRSSLLSYVFTLGK